MVSTPQWLKSKASANVKNVIISINKSTDEKVAELTAPYQQKLSDDEMEQLKSLLYAISLSAEQTGFEVGVRFAVQLLIKLL